MCKPQEVKTVEESSPGQRPKWMLVLFPLLAGLLHLQVFYHASVRYVWYALTNNTTAGTVMTSEEFIKRCFEFERAAFLAYTFDLLCCYLKIIPFSRCNSSRDIIGHHIPVLALVLPLSTPLWAGLQSFDKVFFQVLLLDDSVASSSSSSNNPLIRSGLMSSYLLANGLGFISSLNEVFMCFQRVEMNLEDERNNITRFNDIPRMKNRRFFSSRFFIGVELYYKFFFFWGISVWAVKNCYNVDRTIYSFLAMTTTSVLEILMATLASPTVIRSCVFKVFSLAMYPSMGLRTLKKIKQFHKEGRVGEKVKIY